MLLKCRRKRFYTTTQGPGLNIARSQNLFMKVLNDQERYVALRNDDYTDVGTNLVFVEYGFKNC